MSDFIIVTNGLRRVFSGHAAVDGLDLKVPPGSIFGFLGRNGAGKTTTIRLLLGFLKSGGGEVRLFDELITGPGGSAAIRQRIGYVSENKDLYPYWTVEQIIRFTKSFFPRLAARSRTPLFGIIQSATQSQNIRSIKRDAHQPDAPPGDFPSRRTSDFGRANRGSRSGCNRSRFEGAGDPDCLRGYDHLLFFRTDPAEVEQIADHIAILDHGRKLVSGALDDLKVQYQRIRVVFLREPAQVDWVAGAEHVQQDGRTVSILASRNVDEILRQARSLPGTSVERFPVTLKEIFLEHVRSN